MNCTSEIKPFRTMVHIMKFLDQPVYLRLNICRGKNVDYLSNVYFFKLP